MRKGKVVAVYILIDDPGENSDGYISDAINEMIRPATQDKASGILDYALNLYGNCPELPAAKDYEWEEPYEEGEFLGFPMEKSNK